VHARHAPVWEVAGSRCVHMKIGGCGYGSQGRSYVTLLASCLLRCRGAALRHCRATAVSVRARVRACARAVRHSTWASLRVDVNGCKDLSHEDVSKSLCDLSVIAYTYS
jgi:hypothetical protein